MVNSGWQSISGCWPLSTSLERGEQRRDTGLVIQVTGADVAVRELGQWVEGHEVTNAHPSASQSARVAQ